MLDLDGTIADCRGRHHLLEDDPDWERHSLACDQDPLIEPTAVLVRMLYNSGLHIIAVSGRSVVAYDKTNQWLRDNDVPVNGLYLRPVGDRTSNANYKIGVIEDLEERGYRFVFALEDYHKTADALIAHGIPTILLSDRHQGPLDADVAQEVL